MQKIKIKQVDAFTDRAFAGNPAAVVTEADDLTDEQMLAIANEMNLSETAFVLKSDKADFRIRWFTTEKEVLFCGHATVATIHVLAEEAKVTAGSFKIETLAGILNVELNDRAEIILESPVVNLIEDDSDLISLFEALELNDNELLQESSLVREKLIDYIFLGVKNRDVLNKVQYNYTQLKAYGEKYKIKGFVIFTLDTVDVDSHVHSRFFSPYYDVIEDPVTGSANGPLAVYLLKSGLIKDTKLIKAEQGDILGRPGRLSIAVDEQYQSKLVGKAVTVLEGEILIPSFRA